jgi:hypothetical protein
MATFLCNKISNGRMKKTSSSRDTFGSVRVDAILCDSCGNLDMWLGLQLIINGEFDVPVTRWGLLYRMMEGWFRLSTSKTLYLLKFLPQVVIFDRRGFRWSKYGMGRDNTRIDRETTGSWRCTGIFQDGWSWLSVVIYLIQIDMCISLQFGGWGGPWEGTRPVDSQPRLTCEYEQV